jgi:hypothetical protein
MAYVALALGIADLATHWSMVQPAATMVIIFLWCAYHVLWFYCNSSPQRSTCD